MDYRLDDPIDLRCHSLDLGDLLVGLLLLPLAGCAAVSTAMDSLLHLELHWHAELVGVAAVAGGQFLFLSDLLDSDAALEYLDLMELLLVHILRFVDRPWKAGHPPHCLGEG